MGWGTYYKHTGYLSRISKSEIWSKKEELERNIEGYWRQILAYMAATPPAYKKYDIGEGEQPYAEFIANEVAKLREYMEEDYSLLHCIENCIEAESENEENVTEG